MFEFAISCKTNCKKHSQFAVNACSDQIRVILDIQMNVKTLECHAPFTMTSLYRLTPHYLQLRTTFCITASNPQEDCQVVVKPCN